MELVLISFFVFYGKKKGTIVMYCWILPEKSSYMSSSHV